MVATAHPRTEEPDQRGTVPAAGGRAGGAGPAVLTPVAGGPAESVTAASATGTGSEPRRDDTRLLGAVPALLAPYRDLSGVRHDYPVLVSADDARPVVTPLVVAVDAAVAAATTDGAHPGARAAAYRVEARVVRASEARAATAPAASLGDLWRSAADDVLRETRDPDRRLALTADLAALAAALPATDLVLPCQATTPAAVVADAWHRRRRDLARAEAAALDDLIGRVTDAVAADVAGSPSAVTVDALRASTGGVQGMDFSMLSSLLGGSRQYRDPSPARTTRLKDALAALRAARNRLAAEVPGTARGDREPTAAAAGHEAVPAASCRRALEAWSQDVARRVDMVRAVRIATLELQNRYRPERHDAVFAAFGVDQLTGEERRALSPLLVSLDADALDATEQSLLLEILASDMPVKVFLAVRTLPGAAPADGQVPTEWPMRIAEIAAALGEAYVIQAPMSLLPRLGDPLAAAFEHAGPALIAVYVPPDDAAAALPPYIRAAAAAEARLFPGFVSDPSRGPSVADCLTLVGNVQADQPWPVHRLAYEDADGHPVEEEAAFTAADFLALDERFWPHLRLDGPQRANGRAPSVAEVVAGDRVPGLDGGPVIAIVDAGDRLHVATVGADIVSYARRAAARWARLRELARPRTTVIVQAAAEPPATTTAAPAGEAAGTAATAAPAAPEALASAAAAPGPATSAAAEAPAPPAAAPAVPAPDGPYIDSAMCTACNECTQRNNRLFAYNEAKQAYVKDPRAGTYRELVEAAETCPVCIIHPGRPLDPAEPGLDDLIARAAAFA